MHKVPECRDESEEQEQNDVKNEQDSRNDVEPVGMVRYLVNHNRQSSRTHRDNEPAVMIRATSVLLLEHGKSLYIRRREIADYFLKDNILFVARILSILCFLCFLCFLYSILNHGACGSNASVCYQIVFEMCWDRLGQISRILDVKMGIAIAAIAGAG